jgi:NADPH-dependent ferric siderophore reductase
MAADATDSDIARRPRLSMTTSVRRTERLSGTLVRVVLGGGDLTRFEPSSDTDSYVKVVFLHPGGEYARPVDIAQIRATMPPELWPRQRTYTVRAWDPASLELTLDFVVHGDAGVAGPWALGARRGDEVHLLGPGGGYRPDPAADWHLLVGDESALPAIAVALERLPADAHAHVLVEVDGAGDEIALTMPRAASPTWVHRDGAPVGSRLVAAVSTLTFPAGSVHAFVHGEAGFVKELRRLLVVERGIARERLSISGYWRLGADDEGWRAQKKQWNREVEQAEVAAGVA